MSSEGTTYAYRPLSRDDMRLLKLMPLSSSGDIEIQILHLKSSIAPPYEALSYVWGSPERRHRVAVKGPSRTHLSISRNLFIALDHLRLLKKPRILWIDAICINQDDLAERGEQVQKMGSIYSTARQVVVWLGEESQDSGQAIELLRGLGEGLNLQNNYNVDSVREISNSLAEELSGSPKAMTEREVDWKAVKHLIAREWFTRLWVIQEVVLASNAVVVVGNKQINLPIFKAAIFWLHTQCTSSSMLSKAIGTSLINKATLLLGCHLNSYLLNLLIQTTHTHCLDPRDRIYAILSLLRPDCSANIVPNYSKPPEGVFEEAVLQNIQTSNGLGILRVCRFRQPDSAPKIPSWVVDFSIPFQLNDIIPGAYASGRSKQESSYDAAQESLTVHGRNICTIDHVFEAVPIDAKQSEIFRICRTWEEIKTSEASKIMGATWRDAFVTTIFSGPIGYANHIGADLSLSNLTRYYDAACERGHFHVDELEDFPSRFSHDVLKIQTSLPGRRLFTANDGFMGLCPLWAQKGDIVAVVLGCKAPLVLRSATGGRYQVGGECYVYGTMNGEGLLGSLDPDSRHSLREVNGRMHHVVVNSDGIPTQLDPRAGPLPPGWEICYGSEDSDTEFVDDKLKEQNFYDAESGEWSWYDPRLTSEDLRKMGIDTLDFVLV